MNRHTVYLETTVISVLTARPSRNLLMAAWQQVTRDWWEGRRADFDLFVSPFVEEEARRGDPEAARRRLRIVRTLASLEVTGDVRTLADRLLSEAGLPAKAQQDALQVSCAAVHRMDYLPTWNCTHIANAEFVPVMKSVCMLAGHACPHICTPLELLGMLP